MTQTTCPHCGAERNLAIRGQYICGTKFCEKNRKSSLCQQRCDKAEIARLRTENEELRARLAEVKAILEDIGLIPAAQATNTNEEREGE